MQIDAAGSDHERRGHDLTRSQPVYARRDRHDAIAAKRNGRAKLKIARAVDDAAAADDHVVRLRLGAGESTGPEQ